MKAKRKNITDTEKAIFKRIRPPTSQRFSNVSNYRILFFLKFILINVSVSAQIIHDTIKIEEVAITAYRDISETVIPKIEIDSLIKENFTMSSMSELLASGSIVHVRDYGPGSISSVSMRGTGPSHTQVQWNGIKLNSPLTGQADFSLIPVDFTDRIVVKPGAGSLIDQGGGLGGCILLDNQADLGKEIRVKLGQEIASFDSYSGFASLKWALKKWSFKNRVAYSQSKNDFPYWRNIPLGRERVFQENAAQSQHGFLQEIYFRPDSKNLLSMILWHDYTVREIPPLSTYNGALHDEEQADKSTRVVLKWKGFGVNKSWYVQSAVVENRLKYHLYHHANYNQGNSDDLPLGESILAADASNISQSWLNRIAIGFDKNKGFSIDFQMDIDQHKAEVNNKLNQTGFSKSRNEISTKTALYKQLWSRLTLSLIMRNNLLDFDSHECAPLVGFEYRLYKEHNWNIKGNVARNFNFPAMNDLYYVPGGNPDLQAEKGLSGEISINMEDKLFKQDIVWNLTTYYSKINNWILWVPTEFGWWTPENKQKVYSRGLESRVKLKGNIISLHYETNFSFSLSHTTNESDNALSGEQGQQLIYVPTQSAYTDLNLKYKSISLRYAIDYTGLRHTSYGSNTSIYDLPAFTIHSIMARKTFRLKNLKAGLNFQINNLLNINYESIRQRAMPGRNFAIKVTFEI